MPNKPPVSREAMDKAVQSLPKARQDIADAGLWETFQLINAVVDKIGWEVAAKLTEESSHKTPNP